MDVPRALASCALLSGLAALTLAADPPAKIIEAGYEQRVAGQIPAARKALAELLQQLQKQAGQDPADHQTWYLLARARLELDEMRTGPAGPSPFAQVARAMLNDDHAGEGLKSIERALSTQKENAAYKTVRGRLLIRKGNLPEALAELEAAARLAPADADIWLAVATAAIAHRNLPRAKEALAEAATCPNKDPRTLVSLSAAAQLVRDEPQQTQFIRQALDADDTYARAHFALGQQHHQRRELDAAYREFARVVELNPEHYNGRIKLVILARSLGKQQEVQEHRQAMYAAHAAQQIEADFFMCDEFEHNTHLVRVFEYFRAGTVDPKYRLLALNRTTGAADVRLNLGTTRSVTEEARQAGVIKADEQLFHLDAETRTGNARFGYYRREPDYEDLKKHMIGVLNGDLKPLAEADAKTYPEPRLDDGPIVLNEVGVTLPRSIANVAYVGRQQYQPRDRGYGVSYANRMCKITIYVYDGGKAGIPDGKDGETLAAELKASLDELSLAERAGVYRNIQSLEGELPLPREALKSFLASGFTFDASGAPCKGYILVAGRSNHFLKLRLTQYVVDGKSNDAELAQFLETVAAAVK